MSSEYTLTKNQESKYSEFVLKALKSRGWTPALIKKYLGEPDRRASGRGSYGKRMSLYKKTRVLEAEAKEEFQKDLEVAKQRSEVSKKAWESKGKPTLEKNKEAFKKAWNDLWDVSSLTPETVRNIYNDQQKKQEGYPVYEQATAEEVAELVTYYKEENKPAICEKAWSERGCEGCVRALVRLYISGADCFPEISKADGFPEFPDYPIVKPWPPVDKDVLEEEEYISDTPDVPMSEEPNG
jgi:hypothetical protein